MCGNGLAYKTTFHETLLFAVHRDCLQVIQELAQPILYTFLVFEVEFLHNYCKHYHRDDIEKEFDHYLFYLLLAVNQERQ